MNPNVWGKYQWTAIHFSALGYPWNPAPSVKNSFKTYFMDVLPSILPCESCRNHLRQTLSNRPITDRDLQNSDTLFKWTVDLHNSVNERLNKPVISLTEAKAIYSNVENLRNTIDNTPLNIDKQTTTTPVSITIIDSKSSENSLQYVLLTFMFFFMVVLYIYFMKFGNKGRFRQ